MELTKHGTLKIHVSKSRRPNCQTPGCNNKGQHTGNYSKNGMPIFRGYCVPCHDDRRKIFKEKIKKLKRKDIPKCILIKCKGKAQVKGTDKDSNIIFHVFCKKHACTIDQEHQKELIANAAKAAGMTIPEYLNRNHPSRKYRKNYCENIDGRYVNPCNYKIWNQAQLQVDHIDGNPKNNKKSNLQTLCANCHIGKTHLNKDWATPGRKAQGIKY